MKSISPLMAVRLAAVLALASLALAATAAPVSIGGAGATYVQNFDTLATTGTANAWANGTTLAGWNLFVQPAPGTAVTAYSSGDGTSNTGSFYSFGSTGSGERAMGGLGSAGTYFGSPATPVNSAAGWIALQITNNSGQNLDGFSLSFDGEQWRNGGNTTAQTMVLQYGFGSSFTSVGNWVQPGGLFDWTSTVNTATAASVDGNVAGKVSGRGGAVSTTWNAGDSLWVRWVETNDTGNDHGLAIDNLSFTAGQALPAAVPLPMTFPLLGAGLAVMGWVGRRWRLSV